MIRKNFNETIFLLKGDKITRICALVVFSLCILISFILSYSLALLLLSSYIIGLLICYLLIKFQYQTSAYLHRLVGFYKNHTPITRKITHSCSICDDMSCKRHNQESNSSILWKNFKIDENLNKAIEKFYGRILNDFVLLWYDSLSRDENFINELKYALKYSTASVVNRILKTDIPTLISKKLLPCAIKHIDDYIYIEQITKLKNGRINDIAIEYLGKRLHSAATSRNNELIYLREVTASILPFILPKKYLHCRNYSVLFKEIVSGWVLLPLMDVLADPNIINSLIILGSKYKSKNIKNKEVNEIEFLKNFSNFNNEESSLFYKDLNEIKENTELLYTFMQFLKSEDQVHLLQFCLDVDEFNNKLMAPNLSKKTLDELYGEAITLHNEYISIDSPNYVDCKEEISVNLKELLKEGILSIAKIKVSGPLIQAYKEVFDNLEENWLPIFFQSNEFYSHLCGSKVTSTYNKVSKIRKNESPPSTSVKLSSLSKLRSALKNTTTVDGSIYSPEIQSVEDGNDYSIPVCYSLFRDISTWEISITSYVSLSKVIYFHVNVKRPNSVNQMENRVVLRKDQDFYTLKAKLVEFHGENEICDSPLPARKAGSDVSTRIAGYERFLKKLLQNSTLSGSDLLFNFLTIEEDFSMYISTCGAPVQDLGNIYQSVTQKLRKEKGQHLDSFMNVFMSSIGNKSGKLLPTEIGDEVESLNNIKQEHVPLPKTYRNYIFNDNFGISCNKLRRTSSTTVNPTNFNECLFYLGKHIFNVPNSLLRLYVAICSIISDTVESICNLFIQRELKVGLSQHHLEYLVKFLEEVIFEDDSDPPTRLELENRKYETKKILESIKTKFPYKFLGDNFFNGLYRLWEITQHPHYNKQLMYELLDIVLIELYPNIANFKKN